MLNKLQSHIEIEEINWRKQLQSKDSEIEVLKEQSKNQVFYLFFFFIKYEMFL